MPRAFQEIRAYSIQHDCDMARISMVDEHNQEYFAIISADVPFNVYRERRQEACEVIDAAIKDRLGPGDMTMLLTDRLRLEETHQRAMEAQFTPTEVDVDAWLRDER